MGSIYSVKSGLWSEGGTWSEGVPPVVGDDVTVSQGHTVVVDKHVSLGKSLNLNGVLSVNAGIILKIGTEGNGSDCVFTHGPGSELTGQGEVSYVRGRIQSTATAAQRAQVTGGLVFGNGGLAENQRGRVNYDLAYVDFRQSGTMHCCSTRSRGGYPESYIFRHCSFSGQQGILFGIGGWSQDGDIEFERTHFDNCGNITITMTESPTRYKRSIAGSVFYADTTYSSIKYNASGPWQIVDSVFINYVPDAASTQKREQHYKNCFFSQNTKDENQVLFNYDLGSSAEDCYFYTNPGEKNPHVISIATLRNGVCECESPVEPNIHGYNGVNALIEGVLHLGYGDLDNRVGTVAQERVIKNCSRVSRVASPINALSLHENGFTNGSVVIRNCLHACLDNAGSDARCCRLVGANGKTQTITFENNAKYNVKQWFEVGLLNLAPRSANVELTEQPDFLDPDRGFVAWLEREAGLVSPDYLAGYAYFRRMLGYDANTRTVVPQNSSKFKPSDLVSWVREGFYVSDSSLATAGGNGEPIGIGVRQKTAQGSHLRFTRLSFSPAS